MASSPKETNDVEMSAVVHFPSESPAVDLQSLGSPTTTSGDVKLTRSPQGEKSVLDGMYNYARRYVRRLKGKSAPAPPAPSFYYTFWCWFGCFCGVLTLSLLHEKLAPQLDFKDITFIVGSFGAQACLYFGAPHSPFSQPFNGVVGNVISSTIGVLCRKLFGEPNSYSGTNLQWLAAAICVSTSVAVMHKFRCLHPPAAASSLIACQATGGLADLGFWFVFFPALTASLAQSIVAVLVNNLSENPARTPYPMWWVPYESAPFSCKNVCRRTPPPPPAQSSSSADLIGSLTPKLVPLACVPPASSFGATGSMTSVPVVSLASFTPDPTKGTYPVTIAFAAPPSHAGAGAPLGGRPMGCTCNCQCGAAAAAATAAASVASASASASASAAAAAAVATSTTLLTPSAAGVVMPEVFLPLPAAAAATAAAASAGTFTPVSSVTRVSPAAAISTTSFSAHRRNTSPGQDLMERIEAGLGPNYSPSISANGSVALGTGAAAAFDLAAGTDPGAGAGAGTGADAVAVCVPVTDGQTSITIHHLGNDGSGSQPVYVSGRRMLTAAGGLGLGGSRYLRDESKLDDNFNEDEDDGAYGDANECDRAIERSFKRDIVDESLPFTPAEEDH